MTAEVEMLLTRSHCKRGQPQFIQSTLIEHDANGRQSIPKLGLEVLNEISINNRQEHVMLTQEISFSIL